MLSQKTLLIAIGAIVVSTAGFFLWQSQSADTKIPGIPSKNTGIRQNMSFSQLMQMGENYTCTFSDVSEGAEISGTTYIAALENKFRTDYNTVYSENTQNNALANDRDIDLHFDNASIIGDGAYMYIWNPETTEGFKMKFDPEDFDDDLSADLDFESDFDMIDENVDGTGQILNQNQAMTYDCQPWRVDNSKFIPPSEVVFTDFSSQFEQIDSILESIQLEESGDTSIPTEATYDMSEMCAMCDQLPAGEAQDECLVSLGC